MSRPLVLGLALGLVAVGLLATFLQRSAPPPEPVVHVAVARRAVAPYTTLRADDLRRGPALEARRARALGAFPFPSAVGLMTTAPLDGGDLVTSATALPVERVRFVRDLGLEILSFAASPERLVAGRVRPGHLVNVYGTGRDAAGAPATVLVEARAWVVHVSGGGRPIDEGAPPVPDLATGELEPRTGRSRPATLVTVAVAPPRAYVLIDALQAQHLEPWVTLAAAGTAGAPAPGDLRAPRSVAPPQGPLATADVPVVTPTALPTVSDTGGGGSALDAP